MGGYFYYRQPVSIYQLADNTTKSRYRNLERQIECKGTGAGEEEAYGEDEQNKIITRLAFEKCRIFLLDGAHAEENDRSRDRGNLGIQADQKQYANPKLDYGKDEDVQLSRPQSDLFKKHRFSFFVFGKFGKSEFDEDKRQQT